MKIIFGLIFSGGSIAIILSTPYYGGLGVGMGFCAVALFLVSGYLLCPLFIRIFTSFFKLFTCNNAIKNIAYSNIKEKASKFSVASISLALMFSLNSVMLLNNFAYINDNAANRMQFFRNQNYYTENFNNDVDISDYNPLLVKKSIFWICSKDDLAESTVFGISDPNFLSIDIFEGRNLQNTDEIIIMNNFSGLRTGERTSVILPDGSKKEFTVVGKYRFKYNYISESDIPTCITLCQSLVTTDFNYGYNNVYFNVESLNLDELKRKLENNGYALFINSPDAYKQSDEFSVQNAAVILMIFISFTVTTVALFNTFSMIMCVRKKEFNKLRLAGATKFQIFKMTLAETFFITIFGILSGAIYSCICVGYFSLCSFGKFNFVVNINWYLGLLFTVFLLGMTAGIIPSVKTVLRLKCTYRNE